MCLHVADASSGQMRTQTEFFVRTSAVVSLQPVSIHTLAGGMVRREVQFVKSIHLACDLIFLKNLKSHGAECIVQVITHLCDGMKSARGRHDSRDRTVKVRGYFRSLQLQFYPLFIDQFLDLIFCLIQKFSHLRAKRHIQCRDLFHQKAESPLLADIRALHIL